MAGDPLQQAHKSSVGKTSKEHVEHTIRAVSGTHVPE